MGAQQLFPVDRYPQLRFFRGTCAIKTPRGTERVDTVVHAAALYRFRRSTTDGIRENECAKKRM